MSARTRAQKESSRNRVKKAEITSSDMCASTRLRRLIFQLALTDRSPVWIFCRWLPPTENQLPGNASHQVGVGALVLNDDGDVLVVREKNGAPTPPPPPPPPPPSSRTSVLTRQCLAVAKKS